METDSLSKEAVDIHNEREASERKREGSARATSANLAVPSHMSLAGKLKGLKSEKSDGASVTSGATANKGGGGGIGALMMMKRKLTKWKLGRSSGWSTGSKEKAPAKLENTYRLAPESETKFNRAKVEQAIQDVVQFYLAKQTVYHAEKCSQTSRFIAEEIKTKLKDLGFKRYKMVTNVIIGQDKDQGLEAASRCVWDTTKDDMVNYVYRKNDLFVAVMVYGVYYE